MNSNMMEMMYLQQMFGGGATSWLNVAYLLCLFGIIIFKPQRVRNLTLFRQACFLYVASLVIPYFVLMLNLSLNAGSPASGSLGETGLLLQLLSALGPTLFGLSIFCGFISIIPTFIPPSEFEEFGSDSDPAPPPNNTGHEPPVS